MISFIVNKLIIHPDLIWSQHHLVALAAVEVRDKLPLQLGCVLVSSVHNNPHIPGFLSMHFEHHLNIPLAKNAGLQ